MTKKEKPMCKCNYKLPKKKKKCCPRVQLTPPHPALACELGRLKYFGRLNISTQPPFFAGLAGNWACFVISKQHIKYYILLKFYQILCNQVLYYLPQKKKKKKSYTIKLSIIRSYPYINYVIYHFLIKNIIHHFNV